MNTRCSKASCDGNYTWKASWYKGCLSFLAHAHSPTCLTYFYMEVTRKEWPKIRLSLRQKGRKQEHGRERKKIKVVSRREVGKNESNHAERKQREGGKRKRKSLTGKGRAAIPVAVLWFLTLFVLLMILVFMFFVLILLFVFVRIWESNRDMITLHQANLNSTPILIIQPIPITQSCLGQSLKAQATGR